jgi:hypothetical protein
MLRQVFTCVLHEYAAFNLPAATDGGVQAHQG